MDRRSEQQGLMKRGKESRRYVFAPIVPEETARRSTLKQVIWTLLDGSSERLVTALLDSQDQELSNEEIAHPAAHLPGDEMED